MNAFSKLGIGGPQLKASLSIAGSSWLVGFPKPPPHVSFPTRAVYCTGQHLEAIGYESLWASEEAGGTRTRREILGMRWVPEGCRSFRVTKQASSF